LAELIKELEILEKDTTASQESKDLLDKIVNLCPDWIFVKDKNYRHIMVNEGYVSGVGKSVEDIIGKTDIEIGFPYELKSKNIIQNKNKGEDVTEKRERKEIRKL